jgi:hypothetical protein
MIAQNGFSHHLIIRRGILTKDILGMNRSHARLELEE